MSVARVVARAGVSRSTFYEHFESREDCFLAGLQEAVRRVSLSVIAVYQQHAGGRSERLRASIETLLEALEGDPDATSVIFVRSLDAGLRVGAYRMAVQQKLGLILDQDAPATGLRSSPVVAEATVGGLVAVVQARLLEEHSEPLVTLLNPLMGVLVAASEGPAAAAAQLRRAPPEPLQTSDLPEPVRPTKPSARARVESPRLANGRAPKITYRTLRVLEAIAEHPGVGSREIARMAGVSDRDQITKLLARLERQELIAASAHTPQGKPNAWRLTARAHAFEQAFKLSAAPASTAGERRSTRARAR